MVTVDSCDAMGVLSARAMAGRFCRSEGERFVLGERDCRIGLGLSGF